MSETLNPHMVLTRKTHDCFGCGREFPARTYMARSGVIDDKVWTCYLCGEPWTLDAGTPADNNMHYCPNCGAKMDKEDET